MVDLNVTIQGSNISIPFKTKISSALIVERLKWKLYSYMAVALRFEDEDYSLTYLLKNITLSIIFLIQLLEKEIMIFFTLEKFPFQYNRNNQ